MANGLQTHQKAGQLHWSREREESIKKTYYNLLEEDVDLQPYCCPEPHAELRQDVEVELVAVLAGLQPQHGLAQPRVRAVEVRPGEEHGGAALQRRGRLCKLCPCMHALT